MGVSSLAAREVAVEYFCNGYALQLERFAIILDCAADNADQTVDPFEELTGEAHRMAGTSRFLGFEFAGRKFGEIYAVLSSYEPGNTSDVENVVEIVRHKIKELMSRADEVVPDRSSFGMR